MAVQLEISVETAQLLINSAALRQLSLDEYLRNFADTNVASSNGPVSLAEFERDLDELASNEQSLPVLPDDFSRADIYADHD